MTAYVALLRAVNVGGTGRLPMEELERMCVQAGFEDVRTYIASGNVVFGCKRSEAAVKARLEAALAAYAGKPVGVYFGATSGEVWASRDEGESWKSIARHLPHIYCVEHAV